MKKITFVFKYIIYYIIGLICFSTIAFITQKIITAILLDSYIYPIQDLYNLSNYINVYYPYYLITYSTIYVLLLYGVRKYDNYIVNKLNEKLSKIKKD